MCTIMTFTQEMYLANNLIKRQIESDNLFNDDGFCLVLSGDSPVKLNGYDIEQAIALLDSASFDRAFLHQRYATTEYTELVDTHGWISREGWIVMHNGVLVRKHEERVDSRLIVNDIDRKGIQKAVDNLFEHEAYANCFLIDSSLDAYSVIRVKTGTLYTDSMGNYSTNKVGEICLPVEDGTLSNHGYETMEAVKEERKKRKEAKKYVGSYFNTWKSHGEESRGYGRFNRYSKHDWLDIIPYMDECEFFDLVVDEKWDEYRVPDEAYSVMSGKQKGWLKQIRKDGEAFIDKVFGINRKAQ